MPRFVSVAAAVATAALVGWIACSPPKPKTAKGEPGKISNAPDFALKDIDDRTVHLSDYRGKVVVLDFWATWCPPCKLEIPWLEEFERQDKGRGFAVLGVSVDEDGWSAVRPFIKDYSVNYRVVLSDTKIEDQYGGIEVLPTTFLIDRDGKIAQKHFGLISKKDFQDEIETLLEGKPLRRVRSDVNSARAGSDRPDA